MPPRRKASATATGAQKTLAFGPNSNKVTKPSVPPQPKKLSPTNSSALEKVAIQEVSTPEPDSENVKTREAEAQIASPRALAIRKQAPPAQTQGSEVEQKAEKISDTQIRKYWKAKEDERIAPRVHQQGLSVNEKILRHFDLSSQYGVSLSFTPGVIRVLMV